MPKPANVTEAPASKPAFVLETTPICVPRDSLPIATKNPVIIASNIKIKKGSNFGNSEAMAGVKAVDDNGNGIDLGCYLNVVGIDKVNTNVLGTYKITYNVKGYTGKTVSKTVKVKVVK